MCVCMCIHNLLSLSYLPFPSSSLPLELHLPLFSPYTSHTDSTLTLTHMALQMLPACVELTPSGFVWPRTQHLTSKLPPPDHTPPIADLCSVPLDPPELHAITEISFVHLMVAHYRNQLLFALIPEAMAALSLYRFLPCNRGKQVVVGVVGGDVVFMINPSPTASAVKRFDALHCALYKEFVLPKRVPIEVL